MSSYWVKTPEWFKCLFPNGMKWDVPVNGLDTVYLTFDDGPHPVVTPWVIEQLAAHNAKATFFCVGNNVARYPAVYGQLLAGGHRVGNHTYNHLNGWRTGSGHYLKNINQAARHIDSRLFRPPYGRIRMSQFRKLMKQHDDWAVYMWDILSGDFDTSVTPAQCAGNVIEHIRPGSVVVFHDSEKAWERMHIALPQVLAYCAARNWRMEVLP